MDTMRQAFQDSGTLREPVEIAQSKHARNGIRRPTEQGKDFDSPMFPFNGSEHHLVDALKVLRQNKHRFMGQSLPVVIRLAKLLKVQITPYMIEHPDSIKNEVERRLREL